MAYGRWHGLRKFEPYLFMPWGMLLNMRRGIGVLDLAATQVKRYLTGNGRATKSQMQRAVANVFGLSQLPEPNDVADALAIAYCCAGQSVQQRQIPS